MEMDHITDGLAAITVGSMVSRVEYERSLAAEHLRFDQEVRYRKETVCLLELERAKVQELEKQLAEGLETISNGMVTASKKRAEQAEKDAAQQEKLAADAVKEVAEVRLEMRGRMEGAAFQLGEYHQNWRMFGIAALEWQGKLNTQVRLVKEADALTSVAKKAEARALRELAEAKQKIVVGPVAVDLESLSEALSTAESKARAEMALRLKAQTKLAQVRLCMDQEREAIAQLRAELKNANKRGDKIEEIFRSGPFRFDETAAEWE